MNVRVHFSSPSDVFNEEGVEPKGVADGRVRVGLKTRSCGISLLWA